MALLGPPVAGGPPAGDQGVGGAIGGGGDACGAGVGGGGGGGGLVGRLNSVVGSPSSAPWSGGASWADGATEIGAGGTGLGGGGGTDGVADMTGAGGAGVMEGAGGAGGAGTGSTATGAGGGGGAPFTTDGGGGGGEDDAGRPGSATWLVTDRLNEAPPVRRVRSPFTIVMTDEPPSAGDATRSTATDANVDEVASAPIPITSAPDSQPLKPCTVAPLTADDPTQKRRRRTLRPAGSRENWWCTGIPARSISRTAASPSWW